MDRLGPMSREELPAVSFASLGGTITMMPATGGGIAPSLTADDLVQSAPGLGRIARVRATTLARTPGASLTESDVVRAVGWARTQVDEGASGVVLIQGTDTLEETSFLAECLWDRDAPLVFTGAMRGPAQVSADGPSNLLAAARVAGSTTAQGVGSVVVLDNTVHRASLVHKAHSTALGAFRSYAGQVLGHIIEDEVWLAPLRVRPTALDVPHDLEFPFVPIWSTYLGDDGTGLLELLRANPAGVVIAGFGAGHVSSGLAAAISAAVMNCPVVVTTRIGEGGALRRTYGFDGSEMNLQERGALIAGSLDAPKARLLLALLLAIDSPPEQIDHQFELRGVRY